MCIIKTDNAEKSFSFIMFKRRLLRTMCPTIDQEKNNVRFYSTNFNIEIFREFVYQYTETKRKP